MFSEEQNSVKLSPENDFSQSISSKTDSESVSVENDHSEDKKGDENAFMTFTWHEHVYRKLTAKPTPHYIENILGLQGSQPLDSEMENMCFSGVQKDNLAKVQSNLTDTNEPLNLSIRTGAKVKTKISKGELESA